MFVSEYRRKQKAITSRALNLALRILLPFKNIPVDNQTWKSLLNAMYPIVYDARSRSARLAREFYDSQRKAKTGSDDYDIDLAPYDPKWFAEAMEPARRTFKLKDTSAGQVAQAAMRAGKEVENGGRSTQLTAVRGEKGRVGWARVATGQETCAFCLMLVSRGPIYESARDAGFDTDDQTAMEILDSGADQEALKELMTRWHPGCDCLVVPVFDAKSWEGRDDYLRAKQIWADTTGGFTGVDKLNAFRRAIEKGEVLPEDFAVAA